MTYVAHTPEKIQALRDAAWRDTPVPDVLSDIVSMMVPDERAMLYYLARNYFAGEGVIVDAGCFLGGSTLALGLGVKDNPALSSFRLPVIKSYDMFRVEPWAVGKHWRAGSRFARVLKEYKTRNAGESFLDLFQHQIEAVNDVVEIYEGDVCAQPVPQEPIEILFLDILKTTSICDFVIENYFRRLIPGKSILVQQDYLWRNGTYWIHITMEILREYFEPLASCKRNSVVFHYKKEIPSDYDLKRLFTRLSADEREHWMARAIDRWEGVDREFLVKARQQMRDGILEAVDESVHQRTATPSSPPLTAAKVTSSNLNPWCVVPDDPFAQTTILHPALRNDPQPEVTVRNVSVGSAGLAARIAMQHEDATNDVVVEFEASRDGVFVCKLEARASIGKAVVLQVPHAAGPVDVTIRVRKFFPNKPAHRCRVVVGPLRLLPNPAQAKSSAKASNGRGEIVVPIVRDDDRETVSITRVPIERPRTRVDELPIPPKKLRAYGEDADQYVGAGRAVVDQMFAVLERHGRPIQDTRRVLEFGCSNGRLLRWFLPYSETAEIWGVDIDANMIKWATENLSDHFNFAVCTQVPHLPYPDGYFDLIFAGSVFTHLNELHGAWMLELARLLVPGAYLYATFLDEAARETLHAQKERRLAKELAAHPAGERVFKGEYDLISVSANPQIFLSNVYMNRSYIERIAKPLLEIVDVVPNAFAGFQSGYLFQKRKDLT